MTLREVLRDFGRDIVRYSEFSSDFSGHGLSFKRKLSISLNSVVMCCLIYRLSHWLHQSEHRNLAGALARMNQLINRAWINPASVIGPGLYVPHTSGLVFHGTGGENLTLYYCATVLPARGFLAAGTGLEDCPRLGDNVTVGVYSAVLGRMRVGDNAFIGFNVVVDGTDVGAGKLLLDGRGRPEIRGNHDG